MSSGAPAIRTILTATDGSPTAQIAEGVATRLARRGTASLVFFSAYGQGEEEDLRARRAVEEARGRAASEGVEASAEVADGEVAEAIVAQADRTDCDLIVLGDVGLGHARRLRLGGVPDRVSHTAPCSVLVVRTARGGREAGSGGAGYGSVLIATDGSPTAGHAARIGAELARVDGARITLVYVGDELLGDVVLRDTAERLDDSGASRQVATGDPAHAIVELAGRDGHDLVVVGNRGMAGAGRALGSVPNSVSHDAPCDVLIVQTVGRTLADLAPGEGAVVDHEGHRIAGYRDESGKLFALSRKCKHLGCGIGWNHALRTWDCPCHGSRYDARGKVIRGPARHDLDPIEGFDSD